MENSIVTKKTKDRDQSGFSLIEVMIAMVIVSFGVLGTGLMQLTAIKGNAFSMNVTEANALIANKIEDYKGKARTDDFDAIKSEAEKEVKMHSDDPTVYKLRTVVQDNTPENDLKTVTVEVKWQNKGVHSIACQTIISQGD